MTKDVILRGIGGLIIMVCSIKFGETMTVRKLCYDAEKHGKGRISYMDKNNKIHQALVEVWK